jgi:uncharacterized membrane-anchored protein YitT (DUF2179 family)
MMIFKKSAIILTGCLLLSLGINGFLIPNKVLDGGVIGLGLICNYLWGFEAGLSILLMSIPIFALAWFKDRGYFFNSLHGLLLSSILIDIMNPVSRSLPYIDPAIGSIAGGALVGLGIGLMLRYGTSTGGTDLLAQFIADLSGMNVGIVILLIDSLVISIGGLLVSGDTFMLSLITVLTVGLVTSLCTYRIAKE